MANHIEKVAIVGASGRVGSRFTEELLKTGKHTITALSRQGSKSTLPDGVKVVQVNYEDDGESLVAALKGQQFLIITLSVFTPPDTHSKIVNAAVKAGVPYIMPCVYGTDIFNESIRKTQPRAEGIYAYCTEIESLGASYVAMICGFWYEWSLALGETTFGFDIRNKKVTFYDEGKTRVHVSTWNQCGHALAKLLSLPESGASPSLSEWKNKGLYFDSFNVSQRDMLDSLNRVLGTTDKDWEISYEPSAERYNSAMEALQKGDHSAFSKALYAQGFFPGHGGSDSRLTNDVLGLPKEELDDATKRVVDMVESGWNPFA